MVYGGEGVGNHHQEAPAVLHCNDFTFQDKRHLLLKENFEVPFWKAVRKKRKHQVCHRYCPFVRTYSHRPIKTIQWQYWWQIPHKTLLAKITHNLKQANGTSHLIQVHVILLENWVFLPNAVTPRWSPRPIAVTSQLPVTPHTQLLS